jgi:hypothetical protein
VAATKQDFLTIDDKFKLPIQEARIDEETDEPTKGDALAPAWKERYGELCLEVEALEVLKVGEVANRLDTAVQRYGVDVKAWRKSERKEAAKKRREFRFDEPQTTIVARTRIHTRDAASDLGC